MGEDEIGSRGSRESAPRGQAAILPQTIDDDAIEAMAIGLDPWHQFGVETVGRADGTKRMDRKCDVLEPGGFGIIERDDFADVADGSIAHQHPHRLGGAASSGVQGSHDVKNAHQSLTFEHRSDYCGRT